MPAFGSIIDALGLRIVGVGTPTNGTDAANKAYVDSATGATVFGVQDVTSTSVINIATSTFTTVPGWVGADAAGLYTSGTVSGVSTFDVPGMYLFNASVTWATGTNNTRRLTLIYKNGVEVRRVDSGSLGGSANTGAVTQQVTHMMPMVAGDTFAVWVWQNTGGNLALGGSHEWQAWKVSNATAYG